MTSAMPGYVRRPRGERGRRRRSQRLPASPVRPIGTVRADALVGLRLVDMPEPCAIPHEFAVHRRLRDARGDRAHTDAVAREFLGERLDDADDGELRGAVGAHLAVAVHACLRRRAEERASSSRAQVRAACLSVRKPRWTLTRSVSRIGEGKLGQRADGEDAGVRDDDVEAPERVRRVLQALLDCASSVTSSVPARTRSLRAKRSATLSAASPSRSVTTTAAPSSQNRRAVASPIPRAAPVTKARLPSSKLVTRPARSAERGSHLASSSTATRTSLEHA